MVRTEICQVTIFARCKIAKQGSQAVRCGQDVAIIVHIRGSKGEDMKTHNV